MTFGDVWFFLARLKASRSLLKNLVVRDLKHRYVGSVGGFFWSVVYPLALLVVYYFVFAMVFRFRLVVAEYGTDNFALYTFCGILPWLMFQDTVLRNCTAITENANLVSKTVIPSEVLPIAIMISNLIHHIIGLTILMGALLVFHRIEISNLWVLAYLPVLVILAQGLGWLVSSLNVFFRDTSQVLNVLMIFWMWLTPIFYPIGLVPEPYRSFYALNPMATLLTGYRNAFLQLAPPSVGHVVILLAWAAIFFLAGALFFRQSKTAFADVL